MPLFTDPVIINDGVAERTFTFRAQVDSPKKTAAGEWVEPSAPLAEDSKLIVKHDSSNSVMRRRLLQRMSKAAIADGALKPITINITITHHCEHTKADIAKQFALTKDATNEAAFLDNFLMGLL